MKFGDDGPYSKNAALLLWFGWIFGFGGIHRIYLGKPISGILYLMTWGLFGVGQVVDLLAMGRMVDEANHKQLGAGSVPQRMLAAPRHPLVHEDPTELARIKLLHAAKKNGNCLTVSQGVMATGKTFKEVEALLDEMAKSGFVDIDNHPESGALIYTFGELG